MVFSSLQGFLPELLHWEFALETQGHHRLITAKILVLVSIYIVHISLFHDFEYICCIVKIIHI
jgi:hypothetical protein